MTTGLVIFAATYCLIAVQRLPFVHLNRPAASLLGAVAMVVFGVLPLPDAYAAIDFDVLVFLLEPHAHRRVSRGGEVLRMGGRVDPAAGPDARAAVAGRRGGRRTALSAVRERHHLPRDYARAACRGGAAAGQAQPLPDRTRDGGERGLRVVDHRQSPEHAGGDLERRVVRRVPRQTTRRSRSPPACSGD